MISECISNILSSIVWQSQKKPAVITSSYYFIPEIKTHTDSTHRWLVFCACYPYGMAILWKQVAQNCNAAILYGSQSVPQTNHREDRCRRNELRRTFLSVGNFQESNDCPFKSCDHISVCSTLSSTLFLVKRSQLQSLETHLIPMRLMQPKAVPKYFAGGEYPPRCQGGLSQI